MVETGGKPEQQALILDDATPREPTQYDREITLGHARRQIRGGDRRTPTPTDPLLVGASEGREPPAEKALPIYTQHHSQRT